MAIQAVLPNVNAAVLPLLQHALLPAAQAPAQPQAPRMETVVAQNDSVFYASFNDSGDPSSYYEGIHDWFDCPILPEPATMLENFLQSINPLEPTRRQVRSAVCYRVSTTYIHDQHTEARTGEMRLVDPRIAASVAHVEIDEVTCYAVDERRFWRRWFTSLPEQRRHDFERHGFRFYRSEVRRSGVGLCNLAVIREALGRKNTWTSGTLEMIERAVARCKDINFPDAEVESTAALDTFVSKLTLANSVNRAPGALNRQAAVVTTTSDCMASSLVSSRSTRASLILICVYACARIATKSVMQKVSFTDGVSAVLTVLRR